MLQVDKKTFRRQIRDVHSSETILKNLNMDEQRAKNRDLRKTQPTRKMEEQLER